MTKDTSGPAFPQNDALINRINNHDGMTLRQWYAGMAMQGMLNRATADYMHGPCNEALVERAFTIADAMLSASEQERKP